ncbi:MAG: hypothetical protein M3Y87_31900 [Myxococcota bacterium]|nr:hypothetical protein [Myxococcota bacterium]
MKEHSAGVRDYERFADAPRESKRVGNRQRSALEARCEVLFFELFYGQVEAPLGDPSVDEANDGRVLDSREEFRLPEQSLGVACVVIAETLQRDDLGGAGVPRTPDLAHAARSNALEQLEATGHEQHRQ